MAQRIYDNYISEYGYAPEKPKYLIAFAKKFGKKINFKEARQIIAANITSAPKKQSKPISSVITKEFIETTSTKTKTVTFKMETCTNENSTNKMQINKIWPPVKSSFSVHPSQTKQFIAGPRTKINTSKINAINDVLSKKKQDKKSTNKTIPEPGQISQNTISTLDALLRKPRTKPKKISTSPIVNTQTNEQLNNFNCDPRFVKYNKMKKIGMPVKSVKMWMKADGLNDEDISTWTGEPVMNNCDEKEIQNNYPKSTKSKAHKAVKPEFDFSKISETDPFFRYYKMKKVGLTIFQIKMWMKLDGCSERQIAKFCGEKYKHKKIGNLKTRVKALQNMLPLTMVGANSSTFKSVTRIKIRGSKGKKSKGSKASSISISKKNVLNAKTKRFNRQIAKYNKMVEMGVSIETVKYRMKCGGLTPTQIAIWANEPLPEINKTEIIKENGTEKKYKKYHKMLKVNMPMQSIKNRMRVDGFNEQQIAMFAGEKIPERKGGKSEKTMASHRNICDDEKLEAIKAKSKAIMCRVNFECTSEQAKQEICDALKIFVDIQLGTLKNEDEEKESDVPYYPGTFTYHFTCPDPINEPLRLEFIELYQDEQIFWKHASGKSFFRAFFKAFGKAKNRKSRIFITVGEQLSAHLKRSVKGLESTFPGSDAGFLLSDNYLNCLDKADSSKVIFKCGMKSINYCKIFKVMNKLSVDAKQFDAVMFHVHRLDIKGNPDEFELVSIWPNMKCLEQFLMNKRVKENVEVFKGLLLGNNDKAHFESELYSDGKMDDDLFAMINDMFKEIGEVKQLKSDIGYILHPKANSSEIN